MFPFKRKVGTVVGSQQQQSSPRTTITVVVSSSNHHHNNNNKKHIVFFIIGFVSCIALSLQQHRYYKDVITTPTTTTNFLSQQQRVDVDTRIGPTSVDVTRTTSSTATVSNHKIDDTDKDCIFRHSPLYRKVYVYPNPNEEMELFHGDILSAYAQDIIRTNASTFPKYPFLEYNTIAKNASRGHYNIYGQNVQYTTELLVRALMIHPQSCLRTNDPERATLFYIPYLPSMEHHLGTDGQTDYSMSPYGKAILDLLDRKDTTGWETTFGYTSKYWNRNNGTDHILVFSEPMHGLYHPRNRRGNYHFINSQKQLSEPIVISVELSTTFVQMYPKCTTKNILVPYPNTNGNWFNDNIMKQVQELYHALPEVQSIVNSSAALPSEKELFLLESSSSSSSRRQARPIGQYYAAGNHGTCRQLRRAMQNDYRSCSSSYAMYESLLVPSSRNKVSYDVGMRLATFCPAPGGDSPSAKRMYDALIAGCIPIILSHDFVWPFTKEFDPSISLDPLDFSIRLNASDYDSPLLDPKTCQPMNVSRPGLQAYLESIPIQEIQRLRDGVRTAGSLYSWYEVSESLPSNPLQEGILPNGGTAHYVVQALSERASDASYNNQQRWLDCQQELTLPRPPDPNQFKC